MYSVSLTTNGSESCSVIPSILTRADRPASSTHLKLTHDALAASIPKVLADGEVVVVVRALVRRNERLRLLQHSLRHPPRLLRLDVVGERAVLRPRRPEGLRRLDDRRRFGVRRRGRRRRSLCSGALEHVAHRCPRSGSKEDVCRQGVLVVPLVASPSRVERALYAQGLPDAHA